MSRRSWIVALLLVAAGLTIILAYHRREHPRAPAGSPSNVAGASAADSRRFSTPAPLRQQPSVVLQPVPAPSRRATAPNGAFEGRVVSALKRTGLAAQLTFSRAEEVSTVESAPDGTFHFDARVPGRWFLAAATAPGHKPFAPEWGQSPVVLDATPGKVVGGIIVTLFPIEQYEGHVVDSDQKPISGATVRIFGAGMAASALVPLEDRYQSDANGIFRFSAPDEAVVEARHDGFRTGRARVDYAVRVSRKLMVQLEPAGATGSLLRIDGTVEGPDGAAAESALVSASAKDSPGAVPVIRRTDAQGHFMLTDLRSGIWRLVATRPGAGPASAEVPAGTAGVRLRLVAGGRLAGRVTDEGGSPIPLFTIVVVQPDTSETLSFIDADGRYDIRGLAPGPAVASAVAPDHAPSKERQVAIAADDTPTTADFLLTKGGSLTGVVVERGTGRHLGGATVTVEGTSPGAVPIRNETTADEDGRFVLQSLEDAPIGVSASAPDHHARIISVPAIHDGETSGPMTIELSPVQPGEDPRVELVGIGAVLEKRKDTLVIVTAVAGGGAAEVGLGTGDEIVSIDGAPVQPMTLSDAVALVRGPEGTSVTLAIVKAGDSGRTPVVVVVTRRLIRA